jgi:hypothetical protein
MCSALGLKGVQITPMVTSCSDYSDRRIPSTSRWCRTRGFSNRVPGRGLQASRGSELQEEEMEMLAFRSNLAAKRRP